MIPIVCLYASWNHKLPGVGRSPLFLLFNQFLASISPSLVLHLNHILISIRVASAAESLSPRENRHLIDRM